MWQSVFCFNSRLDDLSHGCIVVSGYCCYYYYTNNLSIDPNYYYLI